VTINVIDKLLDSKFGELRIIDLGWGWFPLEVIELGVNFLPLVHWVGQVIVIILHYWLSWVHNSSHSLWVIAWKYHEFERNFVEIVIGHWYLRIALVSCFPWSLQFLAFSFKLLLRVHFMLWWEALNMLKVGKFFFLVGPDWFLIFFLNVNH
jgi:hypothetical protein